MSEKKKKIRPRKKVLDQMMFWTKTQQLISKPLLFPIIFYNKLNTKNNDTKLEFTNAQTTKPYILTVVKVQGKCQQ